VQAPRCANQVKIVSTGLARLNSKDEGRALHRFGNTGLRTTPGNPEGVRKFLHIRLDFKLKRISIEVSPPIQFRIEWADSQGMSPLLGCRPILISWCGPRLRLPTIQRQWIFLHSIGLIAGNIRLTSSTAGASSFTISHPVNTAIRLLSGNTISCCPPKPRAIQMNP
jgi:hypothetical protein